MGTSSPRLISKKSLEFMYQIFLNYLCKLEKIPGQRYPPDTKRILNGSRVMGTDMPRFHCALLYGAPQMLHFLQIEPPSTKRL